MGAHQNPKRTSWEKLSGATVLFVHDGREHLSALEDLVSHQRISFNRVRNCQEAREALDGPVPIVIFTDTKLLDGTFEDILAFAAKAREAVSVLVASEIGNIRLYEDAMERGAFDFLTPNVELWQFQSIFASAVRDAQDRRAQVSIRQRLCAAPALPGPVRLGTRPVTAASRNPDHTAQGMNDLASQSHTPRLARHINV